MYSWRLLECVGVCWSLHDITTWSASDVSIWPQLYHISSLQNPQLPGLFEDSAAGQYGQYRQYNNVQD